MLGGVVSNTSAETIKREILITDATGTVPAGNCGKGPCVCVINFLPLRVNEEWIIALMTGMWYNTDKGW